MHDTDASEQNECVSDRAFFSVKELLASYLEPDKIDLVEQAYHVAKAAHDGVYRQSGDPYITHPVAVCRILAEIGMDYQSLMAALLHDVIEDTELTYEDLRQKFGATVADLVDGVSKLTQIEFRSRAEAQAENFQKMTLAMAKDIRVILVKLADRLHNMRTLGPLSYTRRKRIATETLEIYAPIATRLGIYSIRVELEDLAFASLYPMRARYIRAAVRKLRGSQKEVIDEVKKTLEEKLAERGIKCQVIGREKHLNSIYQKMKSKDYTFKDIMDVYGFRVITTSDDDCYRALGVIHRAYKPVHKHFKDYIAVPKVNGYQSLHTIVVTKGLKIEVQIRTEVMDDLANHGVAAHWIYKSHASDALTLNQMHVDRWVEGLMLIRENAGNSLEFIEHVKIDLYKDEVYVFTPKGEIQLLPAGATAVDFAYSIHTDVGNSCVACRVNKRLYPLSAPLSSGQTVEIITAPGAQPSPAWLSFVVTARAKSSIKHYLKQQKMTESRDLGRQLLKRSLRSLDKKLSEIPPEKLLQVARHNQLKSFDELLEQIGLGNRMPFIIARQLTSEDLSEVSDNAAENDKQKAFVIEGTEGLVIKLAPCCKPIPGDPIVGVMGVGEGLIIHSETCEKLNREPSSVHIYLTWAKDITDEFAVALRVEAERQRAVISDLSKAIASAEADIEKIDVVERNAKLQVLRMIIHVKGRKHLAKVMRRIKSLRAVTHIAREKNQG